MKTSKLIIVLMTFLSLAAWAESYLVARAYEVAVKDMILPSYSTGSISFKECDTCDRYLVPVTSDTRYILNKVDVTLGEFKLAVSGIADKDMNTATVVHHLESDIVIEVHVVR